MDSCILFGDIYSEISIVLEHSGVTGIMLSRKNQNFVILESLSGRMPLTVLDMLIFFFIVYRFWINVYSNGYPRRNLFLCNAYTAPIYPTTANFPFKNQCVSDAFYAQLSILYSLNSVQYKYPLFASFTLLNLKVVRPILDGWGTG